VSTYTVTPRQIPSLSPAARDHLTGWIARVRESDRRADGHTLRPLAALPASACVADATIDVVGEDAARRWIVRYTAPDGSRGEYRLTSEDAATRVLARLTAHAPAAPAPAPRRPRAPRAAPAPAPAPAPVAPPAPPVVPPGPRAWVAAAADLRELVAALPEGWRVDWPRVVAGEGGAWLPLVRIDLAPAAAPVAA
jgi:hypothetical protein